MSKISLLHLNSYYIDNHLYSQLYSKLDDSVKQNVYIPIKLNRTPENVIAYKQTKLIFDKIIRPSHKYNYFGKIKFLYEELVKKGLQNEIDYVHAHNLFTDGALAYRLHRDYNIPYIVAVRTTDINLQYKYMYHRRSGIDKVLRSAEKIIFISPVYRDKLFSMMPKGLVDELKFKSIIIPNGIDDMWLQNKFSERDLSSATQIKLLYVGQIMARKNITNLLESIELLNKRSERKYTLTIIGGKNQYESKYYQKFLAKVEKYDWLLYKGKIKNIEELIKEYRSHDIFTMPSKNELFGLVYIEALSQGLPIVYSNGEGIDGFFDEIPVGLAVNPDSQESIANGIEKIAQTSFNDLSQVIDRFDWNKIASEYFKLYKRKHE